MFEEAQNPKKPFFLPYSNNQRERDMRFQKALLPSSYGAAMIDVSLFSLFFSFFYFFTSRTQAKLCSHTFCANKEYKLVNYNENFTSI